MRYMFLLCFMQLTINIFAQTNHKAIEITYYQRDSSDTEFWIDTFKYVLTDDYIISYNKGKNDLYYINGFDKDIFDIKNNKQYILNKDPKLAFVLNLIVDDSTQYDTCDIHTTSDIAPFQLRNSNITIKLHEEATIKPYTKYKVPLYKNSTIFHLVGFDCSGYAPKEILVKKYRNDKFRGTISITSTVKEINVEDTLDSLITGYSMEPYSSIKIREMLKNKNFKPLGYFINMANKIIDNQGKID